MKAYNASLNLGVLAMLTASIPSVAQTAATLRPPAPIAASAPTAVPSLIPFSGASIAVDGKLLSGETSAAFQIYKEESGGEALWTETQAIVLDPTGHYQVQLGAANPNGLPGELFSNGEARWLEVQIAGQIPQPRVLLASVPYALKAADAATLGGLPASAFMLAGARIPANAATAALSPDTIANVTTTGGTANQLAKFSSASSIVNSIIYDNGTQVGIGTAAPTATLTVDGSFTVDGASTLNGVFLLAPGGTATATKGYSSQSFKMQASAYNSSSHTAVAPRFEWQAEPTGNNTASPNGTLNLAASSGTAGIANTGLYFSTNGIINFAPNQTFPGTGTITGVSAGTALTGGGTSGNVTINLDITKAPLLAAANNTFTGNQTILGGAVVSGNLLAGSASLGATRTGPLTTSGMIVATGAIQGSGNIVATPSMVATASNGGGQSVLTEEASVYNNSSASVTTPSFSWKALPVANDTSNPSAELALDYYPGAGSFSSVTGLSINSKGLFTFANGQTFPGTGPGTITGVTANSPLTGGGTAGTVAVGLNIPALESTLNNAYVTGVTAGTDLTGGGNGGNVTLNLNTAATDARYAQLAAANTFTGSEFFKGLPTFEDGFTAYAESTINTNSLGLQVLTSSGGSILGQLDVPTSASQYGWAIKGAGYNAYSGVYGYGDDNSTAGVIGDGNIGVYAHTDEAHALDARNGGASTRTAAVYAQAGTLSAVGQETLPGFSSAIFADGGAPMIDADGNPYSLFAIVATTQEGPVAYFGNSSDDDTTLTIANNGSAYLLEVYSNLSNRGCYIDGNGNLVCDGSITGSNITADARTVKTYGVQSAENWYEDAGSGQLKNGVARISLDPTFGDTVNAAVEYHVFLTPNGDSNSLYVTNKTASGFEVHESGHGTSTIAFDYRIMAKRKGYEQIRLEDITDKVKQQREEHQKFHPTGSATLKRRIPTAPPVPQRVHPNAVAQLNQK